MQIVSVNVGRLVPLQIGNKIEPSGIFKDSTAGPVVVSAAGLFNDVIADVKHHGGPDQAVYVYGTADYAWWSAELGTDLPPGQFGENLTISDLESAGFAAGDRLLFDSVILEVTAPRIPCSTLAARMGDPKFVKRYRAAERPGLYCRVIQTGTVQTGERVVVEPYRGDRVTILEMFHDYYDAEPTADTLRRFLAAPIAIRARVDKEEQLQKLLAIAS